MKKLLSALAFLLLGVASLSAQEIREVPVRFWQGGPWLALTASSQPQCFNISGLPILDHLVNYSTHVSPSVLTITVSGRKSGAYSTISTGTTITGGSLHFTGTYNDICIAVTTLTGAGATVDLSYLGSNQSTISATTAFISDGADAEAGSTTDAKCATTDATPCTDNSLQKAISYNTGLIAAAVVPISTGCTVISTASTNSNNCKASAGTLIGFWFINVTATVYYVRPYNLATAPTCSSATGVLGPPIPIPADTTGKGVVIPIPNGKSFSTGLGYCITASGANTANDNAAAGVFGEFLYN